MSKPASHSGTDEGASPLGSAARRLLCSMPRRVAGEPANGLTCGIDLALTFTRSPSWTGMAVRCTAAAVSTARRACANCWRCWRAPESAEVAIERPDGPVVDALLDAGITVVVISPNQLKNLRSRYGSAGNKDDRFDAFCWQIRCAPTGPDCVRWSPAAPPPWRCARPPGPQRPGHSSGGGGQPAA